MDSVNISYLVVVICSVLALGAAIVLKKYLKKHPRPLKEKPNGEVPPFGFGTGNGIGISLYGFFDRIHPKEPEVANTWENTHFSKLYYALNNSSRKYSVVGYSFICIILPIIPVGCYEYEQMGPATGTHKNRTTKYRIFGSEKWSILEVLYIYLIYYSIAGIIVGLLLLFT